MGTTTPDHGYEPWARAAVERGAGLTVEMGRELLETLDNLRSHIAELEGRQEAILGIAERELRTESLAAKVVRTFS